MIATIPIAGDFNVSMSQNKKQGSINSAESLPSPTIQSIGGSFSCCVGDPLLTHLCVLDITLSVEGERDHVSVIVTNAQALQDFIVIARGLKELFGGELFNASPISQD